jgi:hypothetical protein
MSVVPPCAGKWALFDSTDPADHIEAALLCAACPMRAECGQRLESARNKSHRPIHDYGPQGTWAGRLIGAGPRVSVERARAEAAMFTDDELRAAHASYALGVRTDRVVMAERIYQRNRKRRAYAAKKEAA